MEAILVYLRDIAATHKARVVQLIARSLAGIMLGIAGAIRGTHADSVDQIPGIAASSEAIAVAVVAVLCLTLDLVIHRVRHGGVVRDQTPKTIASKQAKS